MNTDVQTVAALCCVLLAAADVLRRAVRLVAGGAESGCGAGCGACPSNPRRDRAAGPAVVSLDLSRVPR